jgi:iron(III) transport system substrate-binding protein
MSRSRRLRVLSCSLAVLASTFGLGVSTKAADRDEVVRIVNMSAADRQAVLQSGARREGALLVYTVGAQIDPLIAAFRKEYPWLNVRVFKGDATSITRKVKEEYGAGVYNVDAFELNDYALGALLPDDVLAPFNSPEFVNYPSVAIEAGRHWAMMRQDLISLGFNTDAINEKDAPRTNADLLDPKWKRRLGLYGETAAIAHWIGAVILSEGEDFLRKVAEQQPTVYNIGGRAVANLIVSGEAPIVINARRSHMFASQREGAKVAWRAIGSVYSSVSAAAIATRANNPHAAALFVDFMLSAAAQKIYQDDLGYVSMRKDLAEDSAGVEKLYIDSRPDFYAEYEKWTQLGVQLLMRPR